MMKNKTTDPARWFCQHIRCDISSVDHERMKSQWMILPGVGTLSPFSCFDTVCCMTQMASVLKFLPHSKNLLFGGVNSIWSNTGLSKFSDQVTMLQSSVYISLSFTFYHTFMLHEVPIWILDLWCATEVYCRAASPTFWLHTWIPI